MTTISSLQGWRDHARAVQSKGQWCYDTLWLPLAPFFQSQGYELWTNIERGKPGTMNSLCHLTAPNAHARNWDRYSYTSPYLSDADAETMRHKMQQMSPVICPARTSKNDDVMIRLVAVGSFGEQHSRSLGRLGAAHLTSSPRNHSLPVLNWVVYQNTYHFAVFPKMQDVLSLPDFHDYIEAADYIEQLVQGLAFLHENLVSHGDICKENILVNLIGPPLATADQPFRSQFPVRYYYADLEFSTCFNEGEKPLVQGSPMSWSGRGGVYSRASAPELSQPGFYSPFQADVWQLGHLLHNEFVDFPHFEGYQTVFRNMMNEDLSLRSSANETLAELRQLRPDLHPDTGLLVASL